MSTCLVSWSATRERWGDSYMRRPQCCVQFAGVTAEKGRLGFEKHWHERFLPCILCFATHGIVIIVVIGGTCQSAGTGLHGLCITCLVHVQVP